MTDQEFKAKYAELVEKTKESLLKEGERLLHCGGVAVSEYEDNYLLPKIILTVALENEVDNWSPFNREDQATIKNLRHF